MHGKIGKFVCLILSIMVSNVTITHASNYFSFKVQVRKLI